MIISQPEIKFGIIYRATSPSGKVYIGQTIRMLKRRKYIHEKRAFTGCYTKFAHAIRKYKDKIKWEILHSNIPEYDLDRLEQKEISCHDSFNNGYNGTLGGDDAGFRGKKHSNATKQILSKMRKGEKNPMFGMSGELNPFYGKKHSEGSKKKMRENCPKRFGEENPMYGIGGFLGKKHSKKTKETLSDMRKGNKNPFYGKTHSEETKRKMRQAAVRRKNGKST